MLDLKHRQSKNHDKRRRVSLQRYSNCSLLYIAASMPRPADTSFVDYIQRLKQKLINQGRGDGPEAGTSGARKAAQDLYRGIVGGASNGVQEHSPW